MKNHKLQILGISFLFLITACKKTDIINQKQGNGSEVNQVETAKNGDWKTVNWNSKKGEKFTTYTATIVDSSITNAITNSGLVLVFEKSTNIVKALPYQDNSANDSYWYYQVSKGEINLSCDNYSNEPTSNKTLFKYFVLSPEALKNLEVKGYSKTELMQLTYESAATILNK